MNESPICAIDSWHVLTNSTLEALSGSDTKKMKEAAEEMKAHLLKTEEVKSGQPNLSIDGTSRLIDYLSDIY